MKKNFTLEQKLITFRNKNVIKKLKEKHFKKIKSIEEKREKLNNFIYSTNIEIFLNDEKFNKVIKEIINCIIIKTSKCFNIELNKEEVFQF